MNRFYSFFILLLFLCNIVHAQSKAQHAFQYGQYEQAIELWASRSHSFKALFGMARAYRRLGAYDEAFKTLNLALPMAKQNHVLWLNEFSKLRLSQGKFEEAMRKSEEALELARQAKKPLILAEILKHRGNLLTVDYDYQGAVAAYREALKNVLTDETLSGKILISLAQTTFLLEGRNGSLAVLKQAYNVTKNWQEANHSQALALISLSLVAQQIQADDIAYHSLRSAQKIAERLNNATTKAYAYGYLGELYEHSKRYDDALVLTRQAVFFAQETRQSQLLYMWQWQLARIKKAQGDKNGAIAAYQQAIKNLSTIRVQVATTGYLNLTKTFRERIAPIYFEFADLLLQQSSEKFVLQAIKTIELFKEAELQDYFQTECAQTECTPLEEMLDAETAILYPIPLSSRLELLLMRTNGLVQTTIPIREETLRDEVLSFLSPLRSDDVNRSQRGINTDISACQPLGTIAQVSNQSFLKPAQTLYRWLIKPLLPHLQGIKTLIIAPDGVLRTMPFAALHDGQEFLIQKYAVAITPSLCLSKVQTFSPERNSALLIGLSKGVQGFSPLPCAKYELEELHRVLEKSPTPLLNETFTLENVTTHIKTQNSSIVHIASHGQFQGDLENTFILTYDGKLSMNKLERLMALMSIQGRPVDLLTLSACETAVGDDRAALGLAGVALKAGVKSALASLWKVDDAATPAVLIEFYQQLQQRGISKAKALQNAQKIILTDKKYMHYRHPYYWSAFLLIGHWM